MASFLGIDKTTEQIKDEASGITPDGAFYMITPEGEEVLVNKQHMEEARNNGLALKSEMRAFTTPEGEKVLVSPANVTAALAEGLTPKIEQEEAAFQGLSQGLTFGFGDEIAARLATMAGRDYDEVLEEQRAIMSAGQKQHPVTSTVTDVAGSILNPANLIPGLGLAGKAAKLGRTAKTAATIGGVAGRAATEGAIESLGRSEDKSLGDITSGALLGGAVGGGLSSLGMLGKRLLRKKTPITKDVFENKPAMEQPSDNLYVGQEEKYKNLIDEVKGKTREEIENSDLLNTITQGKMRGNPQKIENAKALVEELLLTYPNQNTDAYQRLKRVYDNINFPDLPDVDSPNYEKYKSIADRMKQAPDRGEWYAEAVHRFAKDTNDPIAKEAWDIMYEDILMNKATQTKLVKTGEKIVGEKIEPGILSNFIATLASLPVFANLTENQRIVYANMLSNPKRYGEVKDILKKLSPKKEKELRNAIDEASPIELQKVLLGGLDDDTVKKLSETSAVASIVRETSKPDVGRLIKTIGLGALGGISGGGTLSGLAATAAATPFTQPKIAMDAINFLYRAKERLVKSGFSPDKAQVLAGRLTAKRFNVSEDDVIQLDSSYNPETQEFAPAIPPTNITSGGRSELYGFEYPTDENQEEFAPAARKRNPYE